MVAVAVVVSPGALPTGAANPPAPRAVPIAPPAGAVAPVDTPMTPTAAPRVTRAVVPRAASPAPPLEGLGARVHQGIQPGQPWDDGRKTELTFVHLTDTHVGRPRDTRNFAEVAKLVNALEPQPRFGVISGDLTDCFLPAQVERFEEIVATIRVPLYLVPGNHDVGFDPKPRNAAFWKAHFPRFATPYRFDEGPLALIGIDTQMFNSRQKSKRGRARGAKEWEEFEELLAAAHADEKRIVVLGHIPSVPAFHVDKMGQSWRTDLLARYRKLLTQYHVEAELSGHFHRDEIYYSGPTALLNAPPVSSKFGREPSFRVVRVTPEGLSYRQFFVGEKGRESSYEMDLHGLDEAHFGRWLASLPEGDLREFWTIRYAGDRDGAGSWDKLNVDFFRAYVAHPYDFQPLKRIARVASYPPVRRP